MLLTVVGPRIHVKESLVVSVDRTRCVNTQHKTRKIHVHSLACVVIRW